MAQSFPNRAQDSSTAVMCEGITDPQPYSQTAERKMTSTHKDAYPCGEAALRGCVQIWALHWGAGVQGAMEVLKSLEHKSQENLFAL